MSDNTDTIDILAMKVGDSATVTAAEAKAFIKTFHTKVVQTPKRLDAGTAVADALATATQAARTIAVAPFAAICRVYFTPDSAIAADNTDYVTWTAKKIPVAGGAGTSLATGTSRAASIGAMTAFVKYQIPMVSYSTATVAAGMAITVETAKANAGKIVPAGIYTVTFEPV